MQTTERSEIKGSVLTQQQYNAQVRAWGASVRNAIKGNAAQFGKGKTGKYAAREPFLKSAIRLQARKQEGDTVSIAFNMPIHGIFRAWGVGRGQPRTAGKQIAKKIEIKREQSDWIDEPINKEINKLADLAAEYYGDKIIMKLK